MTRVRLLDETKADLALAWEFYEAQEQGAGDYFFQRVDEALGELEWAHGAHPVRYSYFAAPVPRFPYTLCRGGHIAGRMAVRGGVL